MFSTEKELKKKTYMKAFVFIILHTFETKRALPLHVKH